MIQRQYCKSIVGSEMEVKARVMAAVVVVLVEPQALRQVVVVVVTVVVVDGERLW
jgi:hypothetical protein